MIQKNWQELIKPPKLEVLPGLRPDREATIVAEPLERGFGVTLGNALRRVLLSSLQGAAITAAQIDGVLHEFSTIAGVREDVTDIVLNLKALALRLHSDTPKRMYLKVRGPAVVTAGMIEAGHDIEIMDRDHVICHLDEEAELNIEMTARVGRGYVPAAQNKSEDAPIGLIAIDAIYSPVRKVAYRVDHARVGQVTDYDKLTLQVETNGSVTPEDAVALAARILQDQLQLFINFEEPRAASARREQARAAVQPASVAQGRRARALGALGQLPEERQHRLHRRSGAEDRGRDAAHAELRPQVAERDQGGPRAHGPQPRHGGAGLAAGQHRGPGAPDRGAVLRPAGPADDGLSARAGERGDAPSAEPVAS